MPAGPPLASTLCPGRYSCSPAAETEPEPRARSRGHGTPSPALTLLQHPPSHTLTHTDSSTLPISSHTSLYMFTHTILRHTHSQSHTLIHTHWFVLSHLCTLAHRPTVTHSFTRTHSHLNTHTPDRAAPSMGPPDTLCQPCFCLPLGRWWRGGGVPLRKKLHSCERRGFLVGDVLAGGRGDPPWSGLLVQPPKVPSPRHIGWPQSTLPSQAH